jgi:hypothetical protein
MGAPGQAPAHDKPEQLQTVQEGLSSGGAGDGRLRRQGRRHARFLGITDRRIIIQDNSFVGKRTALTSIPYSRVSAVSFVSDTSMFGKFASSSALAISAGGKDYEIEFRGHDKAKYAHHVILFHMR